MAFKPFDLTGKVSLITGGNGGIGFGMAEGLAQAGSDIVIWGSNPDKNAAAEAKLKAHGVRVLVQTVDVGDEAQVVAAMAEAEQLIAKASGKVSAEVAIDVARSFFKLGQKDKACGLLQEVVKNNHENAEISKNIEALFEDHGLAAEGQALIAESRDAVVAINNQGVTLAKGGDLLGGANLLRSAAHKLPHSEVILINLCGLLIGMLSKEGKSHQIAGEARELLERVRHLNAANKNYHVYTAALNRIMGGR